MRSKQTGVTLIGWIILLTPMALCGYIGIRLAPVYLNYMKVARSLESVKSQFKDTDPGSQQTLRNSLEKSLNVESVDYPSLKDIKITREGRSWVISASYDDQAPLFSDISILVAFDKSVTLGGGSNE